MNSFKPRLDILPQSQTDLWPNLSPTRDLGLVLYGGTAVALRLGHRQSIDFDFFTSSPLDKMELREKLPFLSRSTVIQDEPNTLTVLTEGGVKVSFFGGLEFGRYGEPAITEDGVLCVASMDDLMAGKIKVIHQRSESKDYLDIAELLKADVSLEKGLAIAEKMFSPHISSINAMRALVYFEDGDLGSLPDEAKQVLIEATARVSELPVVMKMSEDLK